MGVLWIAGSWGLGVATEKTRCLLVAAMLHLLFNFSRALPARMLWPFLAMCGLTWFFLLRNWPPPGAPAASHTGPPTEVEPPLSPSGQPPNQ